MKTILFVSTNDGSDTRINKEIRTLSKHSKVIFIGVGKNSNCYVSDFCEKEILIHGKRNSILTLSKQVFNVIKVLFLNKINSVHIINEQLFIFFYPLLFFKHTVLDLFDSVFLRKNLGGERVNWFKWLVYLPANKIIVTDKNRFDLMPDFIKKRCLILPNYPKHFLTTANKESVPYLRILYNGWMSKNRGTSIIENLLALDKPLMIYMAGWFSDDISRSLLKKYPKDIKWLGVMEQKDILELISRDIDYIMCTYAPINDNNKNASPNKIYDAIQTKTPIIINGEVKISKWVQEKNVGYVLPKYYLDDYAALYDDLFQKKESFTFDRKLQQKYTWENVESSLIEAHSLR